MSLVHEARKRDLTLKMGKRSRDVSFSPSSGDEHAQESTGLEDPENPRNTKLVAYDKIAMSPDKQTMQCSLPPHSTSLSFASPEEFEVHYVKEHMNRCVECGKNLPSVHFLSLHIDENHNPVRESLAAKGEKTYACFLPDCDRKCSTRQKRRMHMIDKHGFPKVYNFRVIDHGIDNRSSLLHEGRRRRVSVNHDQPQAYHQRVKSASSLDVYEEPIQNGAPVTVSNGSTERPNGASSPSPDAVDELEKSFAALRFVPRSVMSTKTKKTGQK